MGRQGQGGDRRDRRGSPRYLALVMPHSPTWLFPEARSFPRGLTGSSVTGQALGTEAGRAALGRGPSAAALHARGRCSTVGVGGNVCFSQQVASPSALPPPLSTAPSPLLLAHPPISIHLELWGCGQWDLVLMFHLWANKEPLRKQGEIRQL